MLDVTKRWLELRFPDWAVIGGWISPAGDGYVNKKLGRLGINATHRLAMCRLAVQQSDWISVCDWVHSYTSFRKVYLKQDARHKGWASPLKVIREMERQLQQELCAETKGIWVCGADHALRARLYLREKEAPATVPTDTTVGNKSGPQVHKKFVCRSEDCLIAEDSFKNRIIVAIGRQGSSDQLQRLIEEHVQSEDGKKKLNPMFYHVDMEKLVHDPSSEDSLSAILKTLPSSDISSTIIRQRIAGDEAMDDLLEPAVVQYIRENKASLFG
jgi:nicotinic acid mononucleotide adenylyltransferase